MQHRKVATHHNGPVARHHQGAEALRRDPQDLEIEVARCVPERRVADTSSSEECASTRGCDVLTQRQDRGDAFGGELTREMHPQLVRSICDLAHGLYKQGCRV
jgi:hypothetical protein